MDNQIKSLQKIKELLDSGAINQVEFEKLKAELLDNNTNENMSSKVSKKDSKPKGELLKVSVFGGLIVFIIFFFYFFTFSNNKALLVPFLKANGKYVYVDSSSMDVKITKEFDEARLFYEDRAAIMVDKKWGFIDTKGNIIIECKYEECGDFNEGVACFRDNYLWGLIDKNGNEIVPAKYSRIDPFSSGIALVELKDQNSKNHYKDRLFGYIDKSGKEIIPIKHTRSGTCSEGIIGIGFDLSNYTTFIGMEYTTYKWLFYNSKGDTITNLQFDNIGYFQEGMAPVSNGKWHSGEDFEGKWGFIDTEGNIKIPMNFDYLSNFSESLAAFESNNKWGYINKEGNIVIPSNYDAALPFSEGLAAVYKYTNDKTKVGYIDKMGNLIIDFNFYRTENFSDSFNEGYAAVAISDNKMGFIDKQGKLLKSEYNYVKNFKNGVAFVANGRKIWGSDGYAGFEGKWGLINKSGDEVIPLIYDDINIENTMLRVSLNDMKIYVDQNGRLYKEN